MTTRGTTINTRRHPNGRSEAVSSACIGGFYGRPTPSASGAASAYDLTRLSYEKAKHAMDVYRRAKEVLDRSRRAMGEWP